MNKSFNAAPKSTKTVSTEEKEKVMLLKIRANADRVRLSQILELKKIFREHSGKSQIALFFESKGKNIGVLEIDSSWGVKPDSSLKEKLQKISQEAALQWELTE
jgi:DNA polymerase-3 subunit alpha